MRGEEKGYSTAMFPMMIDAEQTVQTEDESSDRRIGAVKNKKNRKSVGSDRSFYEIGQPSS